MGSYLFGYCCGYGLVVVMVVDDEDVMEVLVVQVVEQVLYDVQYCFDFECDCVGVVYECGCDVEGQCWEDWYVQWFGGFDGDVFGQDGVYCEVEVGVLFGVVDGQQVVVVGFELGFDLYLVYVGDFYGGVFCVWLLFVGIFVLVLVMVIVGLFVIGWLVWL